MIQTRRFYVRSIFYFMGRKKQSNPADYPGRNLKKDKMDQTNPFDNTLKRCKCIENRLDSRVQRYVLLVQKLNNHVGDRDVEGGNREERDLGLEIEKDLYEMSECIQSMSDLVSGNGKEYNKESIIKKYQEIQYDHRSEYKRASSSLTYNNPSAHQQLLGNAYYNNNNKKGDNDALLRERNSITSSMSSIYDVINNAADIKKTLASQVYYTYPPLSNTSN